MQQISLSVGMCGQLDPGRSGDRMADLCVSEGGFLSHTEQVVVEAKMQPTCP